MVSNEKFQILIEKSNVLVERRGFSIIKTNNVSRALPGS